MLGHLSPDLVTPWRSGADISHHHHHCHHIPDFPCSGIAEGTQPHPGIFFPFISPHFHQVQPDPRAFKTLFNFIYAIFGPLGFILQFPGFLLPSLLGLTPISLDFGSPHFSGVLLHSHLGLILISLDFSPLTPGLILISVDFCCPHPWV